MVTKLNQIVAVVKSVKEDVNKRTAPLFHSTGRPELFAGITQTYRPAVEGGAVLPPDNTQVQITVPEVIRSFTLPMVRLLDVISTAENTNTEAFGDIVVDGVTLAEHVPVTFLMQVEKYLEREVRGLIVKLPLQDPAENWVPSAAERDGVFESNEFETVRTRKAQEPMVLYPATDKHPAQTQVITVDVIDGYWMKKKFTGAISASDRNALLERCEKLIIAVKQAREQANDREVLDKPIGASLLGYVFG